MTHDTWLSCQHSSRHSRHSAPKPQRQTHLHTACKPATGESWCGYASCQVQVGSLLTPSVPQPVKLPGWKCTDMPVNSPFSGSKSHLPSVFCVLMKILSHASAKKKTKRLKGLEFRTFNNHYGLPQTHGNWRSLCSKRNTQATDLSPIRVP